MRLIKIGIGFLAFLHATSIAIDPEKQRVLEVLQNISRTLKSDVKYVADQVNAIKKDYKVTCPKDVSLDSFTCANKCYGTCLYKNHNIIYIDFDA